MQYITQEPNPNGAYPAPQSNPAPGLLPLTDEQAAMVTEYNGFVVITDSEDGITVEPNTEAWEAWKSSLPPETPAQPTAEDRLSALEAAMLSMMEVQSNV